MHHYNNDSLLLLFESVEKVDLIQIEHIMNVNGNYKIHVQNIKKKIPKKKEDK